MYIDMYINMYIDMYIGMYVPTRTHRGGVTKCDALPSMLTVYLNYLALAIYKTNKKITITSYIPPIDL